MQSAFPRGQKAWRGREAVTAPVFACERCRFMPWEPRFRVMFDRNGVRHHERCQVIARDQLVSAILSAAIDEVAAPSDATRQMLSRAVHRYQAWREEHEARVKFGGKK